MVLSRRGLSAIFLAGAALVFYAALLLSTESGAQTNGDCPGAQTVDTTTGTGNKQSPVFNITGTSFRITITVEATSQDPSLAGVTANVMREGGEFVTSFSKEGPGTESSIINAGPGRFFLDFNTANANYTVTTEDCTGTTGGVTSQDGEATFVDDIQEDVVVDVNRDRTPTRKQPTIINIPKKPLPPSGGPPLYGVIASFILAGTGLLALGIGIRRGLRR